MKVKIGTWVTVKAVCVADCQDEYGRDVFGPGDVAIVVGEPMPSVWRQRHNFQNAEYLKNEMRYRVGVGDDNMVAVKWSNGGWVKA